MANRFQWPNAQPLLSSSLVIPGGKLFFYASGTSTKQATYSDSALTQANANPVILGSDGGFGNVFLQNLSYKVVLAPASDTDPPSNPIYTFDPCYASDFSTNTQFQIFNGNPNNHVAGNQGSVGGTPASVVWDSLDNLLYVCTATGTSLTAVWTAINTTPVGAVPTGLVLPYAGATAPAGWLICDGSSQLRSSFTGLFGVIGTTYGSADGTHFNLPDLRGRSVFGQDNMGLNGAANRITNAGSGITGTTIGASGGNQNVTIAQNALPNIVPTFSATNNVNYTPTFTAGTFTPSIATQPSFTAGSFTPTASNSYAPGNVGLNASNLVINTGGSFALTTEFTVSASGTTAPAATGSGRGWQIVNPVTAIPSYTPTITAISAANMNSFTLGGTAVSSISAANMNNFTLSNLSFTPAGTISSINGNVAQNATQTMNPALIMLYIIKT